MTSRQSSQTPAAAYEVARKKRGDPTPGFSQRRFEEALHLASLYFCPKYEDGSMIEQELQATRRLMGVRTQEESADRVSGPRVSSSGLIDCNFKLG